MVIRRAMVVAGLVQLRLIDVCAAADEPAEKPVEVIRAHGMMAIWGLIILGLMMLIFLRLYTHMIRRRWRQTTKASRMSPQQWQARRWRETWHKTPPTQTGPDDSTS